MEVVGVLRNEESELAEPLEFEERQVDAFGATSPGGTRHVGAGRPASRRVHTPSGPR